jgi:magnesium transporter
MVVPTDSAKPTIRVLTFTEEGHDERAVGRVGELRDLIGVEGRTVWVDIEGFGDHAALSEIGDLFGIHPLAMADLVHVPQRPKAEMYDDRLLIIMHMALLSEAGEIEIEQVGLVLGPGWVVSFRERKGDVFDPVRERIRLGGTRMRRMGADYLAYALLDAVVDGYFPVIETLGGVIDALEEEVIEDASRATLARIHATGRTLTTLHRVQWRQRDAVVSLLRDDELPFSESVRPYLRDVHDHAFQTLDAIETFREMVVGLMDLYLSSTSVRLNEVMKTLTIVATIFIPLTFVTGVYGMNFDHLPELHWRWAYPVFWGLMLALAGGLLLWFRRRGWLGDVNEK